MWQNCAKSGPPPRDSLRHGEGGASPLHWRKSFATGITTTTQELRISGFVPLGFPATPGLLSFSERSHTLEIFFHPRLEGTNISGATNW